MTLSKPSRLLEEKNQLKKPENNNLHSISAIGIENQDSSYHDASSRNLLAPTLQNESRSASNLLSIGVSRAESDVKKERQASYQKILGFTEKQKKKKFVVSMRARGGKAVVGTEATTSPHRELMNDHSADSINLIESYNKTGSSQLKAFEEANL